jgi:quercetin 2,3-dioxygenase
LDNFKQINEHNVKIEIIAGSYKNQVSLTKTFSPVDLFNIYLETKTQFEILPKKDYNTGILVIEGEFICENHIITTNQFLVLSKNSTFKIQTLKKTTLLFLSGLPIEEEICSYGPFLMNTQSEINQAILDFNSGKFGYLS